MKQSTMDFAYTSKRVIPEGGQALARRADPDTSRLAAESVRGEEAGRVERIVLDALLRLGGAATAYQIELEVQRVHPGLDSNSITPRLKPLERKSLVHRTDRRGLGRSTRKQIVWEITGD